MKVYNQFAIFRITVLVAFLFAVSCEEDYTTNSSDPAILLTVENKDIKIPGHGQYRMQAQTGDVVSVKANVSSSEARSFTITKTVNLKADADYGNQGVLTVDPSSVGSEYVFNYIPKAADVDQLIGFTFRVENTNGRVITSDLALVVTLSPRDNLPRRKWLFTSKIWVDAGNVQDIKECEKDNYLLFNDNHTMSELYGAKTGAGSGGCEYDGLNVYDSWTLSDDEKFFTMKYHGLFTPDNIQTDVYRVKTLTTEKLELEIDFDLSWLGLGTAETFVYEYKAQPK